MKIHLSTSTGLAALATTLLLSSCGADTTTDDPGSTPTPEPASSPSPTQESSEPATKPEPASWSLKVPGYTIKATLAATDRFRPDGRIPGRLHFLPMNVVTDNDAERWGDFFLYSPSQVLRPRTDTLVRAPEDLVGWFTSHPGVRVVSTRTHRFGGATAHEVNVERDGSLIFPGDEVGAPGGLERYVLWRVDGIWLVGQASTFRGLSGITAPSGRRDAFMTFLRSVKVSARA